MYQLVGKKSKTEYCVLDTDDSVVDTLSYDVIINYLQSFQYFYDTALFVLAVGGFYGVLNKIPAYKEMVKGIVNKVGDKKKLFVIIMTIVFALVSTLTGLNVMLLLVVPMVVSIVLCSALRIMCSTISGVVVWETPFWASLATNITVYVGWDCLFALIVLPLLYFPLLKINKLFPCSNI